MESTPLVNLGFVDHFKSGEEKYNVEILIYRCGGEHSRRFQFVTSINQEGVYPSTGVIYFDVVVSIDVQEEDQHTSEINVDFGLGTLRSTFTFERFTHEHARALQIALMDFVRTYM